jgi:hypothetical protein
VSCVLAEDWLGRPLSDKPTVRELMWRYLAACGPATVADLQIWSGLRKLRDEVEELRPELVVYRDESGRELFDRPDLALADPDAPAPVRFLPEFDNLVLSHEDRTRIVSDEDRALVCPGYSMVHPTFLVDGFVAGSGPPTQAACLSHRSGRSPMRRRARCWPRRSGCSSSSNSATAWGASGEARQEFAPGVTNLSVRPPFPAGKVWPHLREGRLGMSTSLRRRRAASRSSGSTTLRSTA